MLIKILRRIKYLVFNTAVCATAIICSPLLYMFYALNKWRLRIIMIDSSRIGHFAASIWRYKALYGNEKNVYFCLSHPKICNKQLKLVSQRELGSSEFNRVLFKLFSCLPFLRSHCYPKRGDESAINTLENINIRAIRSPFTEDEDKLCRDWLKAHGWQDGQKIVCLLSRDSAYLVRKHGIKSNYHDYRNSDIDSYRKSVRWLIDRDNSTFVVRMGTVADKQLGIQSSKVVDYPFCEDQSDLLDVWLFSNCQFFISSGSGADVLAMNMGIPGVHVNLLPSVDAWWHSKMLLRPKELYFLSSDRKLSIAQHVSMSFRCTNDYVNNNLLVLDLTEDQILEAVQIGWSIFIEGRCTPERVKHDTSVFKKCLSQLVDSSQISDDFLAMFSDD